MDINTYCAGDFRLERLPNRWQVGRFAALDALGVAHLVTTRQGPDVQQVRHDPAPPGREIAHILGLEHVAFLDQVHGGAVLECARDGLAGAADGLVTAAPGLALLGKSGDCPLVLIADRRRPAVGFAHASWRATVAGITTAVVRRLVDLGCDPADLVACICPSAGPCCYEVGDEVRCAALEQMGPHAAAFFRSPGRPGLAHGSGDMTARTGRLHFDLWRANACVLARAGLACSSIHVAGLCTICRNDLFPSHRREGDAAGRFAAVIGRVAPAR
ncbi:MAG: polyphenol oxidase family protein [Planctomycetes bacterium]|nr:polyphenol oxidase family protein [Planctomycetota bacterium]